LFPGTTGHERSWGITTSILEQPEFWPIKYRPNTQIRSSLYALPRAKEPMMPYIRYTVLVNGAPVAVRVGDRAGGHGRLAGRTAERPVNGEPRGASLWEWCCCGPLINGNTLPELSDSGASREWR